MKKLLLLTLVVSSTHLCLGAPQKSTDKQPWSDYYVHDMQRPHPQQIIPETPLAFKKAPADADILFDGSKASMLAAWTKEWVVQEEVMIASATGNNKTKKSYADCELYIEWRIPAGRKVQGQKGGNSGVFLMSAYEIQVQESHTNVTYADGQAGAIYGQYPPRVNPSLAQGEWQYYHILFKAPKYDGATILEPASITVTHNGVVIHNNQSLQGPTKHKKATTYPKTHPSKAPLMLQWHKDPIEFRNIWIREL